MPTYNTAVEVLQEAVESILNQTLQDFEFIIIDDGSTNDSVAYLQGLQDERIKLIRNPENLGITKSLNIGLRQAKGKYIARMDSDDISLPTRFEKQFKFMERHPDVIACGTQREYFGAYQRVQLEKITDMDNYRISLLFINPGPTHPTVFFRHDMLIKHHIMYDEKLIYAQDYGMWSEICKFGRVCILEEVLLRYRTHKNQICKTHREKQIECDKITQEKLLRELLGNVSKEELDFHYFYSTGYYKEAKINQDVINWYQRLIQENKKKQIYHQRKFRRYIYRVILRRTIRQSFDVNTSFLNRAGMYFHYLPFGIALRTVIGERLRALSG